MDLRKIEWGGMDRIDLGIIEGFCEHGNEASGFHVGKF
jgi:hypothetical protein